MTTAPAILGGANVVPSKAVDMSSYPVSDEKTVPTPSDAVVVNDDGKEGASDDEDRVIVTGYDAAQHLLSLRDDFEPALTFRSIVVASALASFQAVMSQIYAPLFSSPASRVLAPAHPNNHRAPTTTAPQQPAPYPRGARPAK
ncbi:hypothetical protein E4U51_000835 [Claviceps purpurea]|nr:hypothetical protein E4U51_000835 [Claviceps purpurea]